MEHQHIENLFRRFKGELVNVKTLSGGIYEGKVTEITNDYVCLTKTSDPDGSEVYVMFGSIESMMVQAGTLL
jgi:ribosome maturation factor RimP